MAIRTVNYRHLRQSTVTAAAAKSCDQTFRDVTILCEAADRKETRHCAHTVTSHPYSHVQHSSDDVITLAMSRRLVENITKIAN